MQTLIWNSLSETEKRDALSRPAALTQTDIIESVRSIMSDVKAHGDAAVLDYTARFDGASLTSLKVPNSDLKAAWDALPDADKDALKSAHKNIQTFHTAQLPPDIEVETMPGVICRRESRAIDIACLLYTSPSPRDLSTSRMPSSA